MRKLLELEDYKGIVRFEFLILFSSFALILLSCFGYLDSLYLPDVTTLEKISILVIYQE